jgi:DNA-binding XRE family transcriptional regulator
MNAMSPWPALIKRLRFLSSLKQCDLAQQLGVDQGTVSRWERGVYMPDVWMQKRLRDMLQRSEPMLPPSTIEAMPVLALLYCARNMGLLTCCSHIVAEQHGMAVEDMRNINLAPWWTDSLQEMHETLHDADGWRSGEIAIAKAKVFRITGQWCDVTAVPVSGADLVFFTAEQAQTPPEIPTSRCELTTISNDELIA